MHDIEPYFRWRDRYNATEDEKSPFHGRKHDEFMYTQKVYNYFIHPQWEFFGSSTLYLKALFVDYDEGYAILEFIGEWNDTLHNDIMELKRNVIDAMTKEYISKFILIVENVYNFHGSDDSYYEEWWEDVKDEGGWICFLNPLQHVIEEMENTRLQYYVNFGQDYTLENWRVLKPELVLKAVELLRMESGKQIGY
jgi:hypothetical protein